MYLNARVAQEWSGTLGMLGMLRNKPVRSAQASLRGESPSTCRSGSSPTLGVQARSQAMCGYALLFQHKLHANNQDVQIVPPNTPAMLHLQPGKSGWQLSLMG